MSDNHYFMEQELCNGRMNDKIVDKQTKRRQPKHWNEKRTRTESVVVARRGIMARVDVTRSHDDASTEPLIDGGFELLEGLSSDARRALLDEAPRGVSDEHALSDPPLGAARRDGRYLCER